MKTTIDGAGRLVIPSEIRQRAGLRAGAEVDVRIRDGIIEIEPQAAPVRLVQDGPLLVAVVDDHAPPLTREIVEDIRDSLRDERTSAQ